jgi:hypothetical protein
MDRSLNMAMRGCLGFSGLSVVAFSLLMIVTALGDFFTGQDDPSLMIGMAIFFAVTAFGGAIATYLGFRKRKNKELDPQNIERTILGAAKQHAGEVTVEEVALHTPLTIAECKQILEDMVTHGAAEIGLGPNQETIYVFRGFLENGRRKRSYDPFAEDSNVVFEHAEQPQTIKS